MIASFTIPFVSRFQPIMPLIIEEFKLTYTKAGLLMTVQGIPSIIIPFFVGILAQRFGVRYIGTIAFLWITISSFAIAVSISFTSVLLWRLTSGIAFACLGIVLSMTISQWFLPKNLGKAMGLRTAAIDIGSMLAYSLFSIIGIVYGWRSIFYIGAGISTVLAILFISIIREGPFLKKSQSMSIESIRNVMSNIEVWKICFCWFSIALSWFSWVAWSPTFWSTFRNIDLATASFITGVGSLMEMATVFWGWLSDKLEKRRVILSLACLSRIVILPLLALFGNPTMIMLLVIIMGLFATEVPCIMALMAETVGPDRAGIGFGILQVFSGLSITLGPAIIGYIQDAIGSVLISYVCMSVFAVLALVMTILLKTK